MSETEIEIIEGYTAGEWAIDWAPRSKMCHLICRLPTIEDNRPNPICDVIPPGEGFEGTRDEMDANARLIAQAPAMQQEIIRLRERIEALEEALSRLIDSIHHEPIVTIAGAEYYEALLRKPMVQEARDNLLEPYTDRQQAGGDE